MIDPDGAAQWSTTMRRNPFTVDYTDLGMVKQYATELATPMDEMTIILRPGHTAYSIIHTANEPRLLRDAMVVYRTGEHRQ